MLHSIVIPVFNEASGLGHLHRRVAQVIDQMDDPVEVILVDDGSQDGSSRILDEIHERDTRFKVIHLSRNFGHQLAITAGMHWSSGATVSVMDADLQDPPEVILEFLKKWREGFDVVYGVRANREGETWFKLWSAKLFYRLMRAICKIDLPTDTGDFRLLDRKVVASFLHLQEKHRYVRGLVAWLGYRQAGVSYIRQSRNFGTTHYPLSKMLKLAWDGILSFSTLPPRLILGAGCLALAISLGAAAASVITHAARAPDTSYPSLVLLGILALLCLGSLILLSLGVVAQYLVRIADETRNRPLFLVERALGFSRSLRPELRTRPQSAAIRSVVE